MDESLSGSFTLQIEEMTPIEGQPLTMRPKWAFQLLPNTPHVLGIGFRVDPVTQALEDEVNGVLQRAFGFHGISKLVIRLGEKEGERDYHEHLGVAQKYYPDFDVVSYQAMSAEDKTTHMRSIVMEVFEWLITNFDDAQCFEDALETLGWTNEDGDAKRD